METQEKIDKTKEQITILEKGVSSSITPDTQKVIMQSTLDSLKTKLVELENQLVDELATAEALAEQKRIDDELAEEKRLEAETLAEDKRREEEEKRNKKSPAVLKLEEEYEKKLKSVNK